jgi:hypothetical protein
MKKVAALVLGCMLAVNMIGCKDDSNPSSASTPAVVGTWVYTETETDSMGTITLTMTVVINSNNQYTYEMKMAMGLASIVLMTEKGSWTTSGTTITFAPTECKEADLETGVLVPASECTQSSQTISISGNQWTMTEDGETVIFIKQ